MQWAGMTCSEADPCPVLLELSAVEASATGYLPSATFIRPRTRCTRCCLASDDGGKTGLSHSSECGAAGSIIFSLLI